MKTPAQSSIQVKIAPEKVQITRGNEDSYGSLILSIKNTGSDAVSVKGMSVALKVGDGETDLALPGKTSNIKANPGDSARWTFKPASSEGSFEVRPVSGSTGIINGGETVTLYLNDIVLNHATGSTQVTVKVIFPAAEDNITVPVTILKELTTISVRFYAEPSDINPGQAATLKWQSSGIDYCKLSEYPEERLPSTDSKVVNPNFSRAYTLLAYAPNVQISANTYVNIVVPQGRFWAAKTKVDYGEKITLQWECNEYTRSVGLTCDDAHIVIPSPLRISDGKEIGPLTKATNFVLTLYKNDGQPADTKTLIIPVNPPKIDLFTATPESNLWAKDRVVIKWAASSYKTIEILPAQGFPSPLPKSGEATLYPEKNTKYTLTLTGAPARRQLADGIERKEIDLKVAPVNISSFTATPNPIDPSNSPKNEALLAWTASGQVIKIDHGIGNVDPAASRKIDQPGTETTYTLKVGTNQNPDMGTQTVKVLNNYGPFVFTEFAMDYRMEQMTRFPVNNWQNLGANVNKVFNVKLTGLMYYPMTFEYIGLVLNDDGPNPFFAICAKLYDWYHWPVARFAWTDFPRQEGTITLISPFSFPSGKTEEQFFKALNINPGF